MDKDSMKIKRTGKMDRQAGHPEILNRNERCVNPRKGVKMRGEIFGGPLVMNGIRDGKTNASAEQKAK